MRKIKKNVGWVCVVALAVLPAVFWVLGEPFGARFASTKGAVLSFGQVAGLLGFAMFSLNLILSARFKFLEDYFYGLNKIYVKHHNLGAWAFGLILLHPFLLALGYFGANFGKIVLFVLPVKLYWPVLFGQIGFYIFIFLLILTLYVKLKYHIWKFSHKFLGLAFVFVFFHIIFIGSDIAQNLPLKVYLFSLGGAGILSYLLHTILGTASKKFDYEVASIEKTGPAAAEIAMSPQGKQIDFQAGQFLFVEFFQEGLRESHPFSTTSAPGGGQLKIIIKNLGDYTKNVLTSLKLGTKAKIEGPFGRFLFDKAENKGQIWVAGGIGIAPFMSQARDENLEKFDIDLYYSVNNPNEAVFLDELGKIAEDNKNFRVKLWISDEQGFIAANAIAKTSKILDNKDIFLCGPLPMMRSLREQFKKLGVKNNKIHSEEFNLYF